MEGSHDEICVCSKCSSEEVTDEGREEGEEGMKHLCYIICGKKSSMPHVSVSVTWKAGGENGNVVSGEKVIVWRGMWQLFEEEPFGGDHACHS